MSLEQIEISVGDKVRVINNKCLRGNDVAPNLILGDELEIKEIVFDSKHNPHFDVGLESHYNYIRSFETKEELPKGDRIHWCHPSRFEKV